MTYRFFWLALLGAWSGFVLSTWVWAEPLPYPKSTGGQCAASHAQSSSFCAPRSRCC